MAPRQSHTPHPNPEGGYEVNPITLAQRIPTKLRAFIYAALGVAVPVEAIWDFIPAGIEAKLMSTLVALGFGVAFSNVSQKLDY